MTETRPYAAFASRDFRLFFFARLANNFGTNIMMPALGWQVYALTRNPLAIGLIGLATFVPAVLATLPSGHAADHFERQRVYQLSQIVLVGAALSFCVLSLGHVTLPLYFYLGAALFGVAKTFSMPAASAWMPHLVPREHFANAVVWTSAAFQISNVVGPAILGLMLYTFGEAQAYALAAGCYLASLVLGTLIRTHSTGAGVRQKGIGSFFSGISYIARNRLILGATSLDLFALLLGGAAAMLPVYALQVLHVGKAGFGFLRSAPAFGSAATGLYLAHQPLRHKVGAWMFASVAVYGIAIMVFGQSRNFALSLAALVVLGAAETVGAFVRQTLVQLSTHDDMRGRVTAVNMMFVSARNELGDVESGFLATLIGVVPAVVAGGACTLVIAGLWARWFPTLRDVDNFGEAIPGFGSEPAGPARRALVAHAIVAEDLLDTNT